MERFKRRVGLGSFRFFRFSLQAAGAGLILLFLLPAQEPPPVVWSCPMDPEVRAGGPGKCSRCGMDLEPRIPEPVEYRLRLSARPAAMQPGRKVELQFEVLDPERSERVKKYRVVHEKLFHLFVISQDLEYFAHEHPVLGADSLFHFRTALPKPGAYRLLCDFYPEGGTPQLIPKTLILAGAAPEPRLSPDLAPKRSRNLEVELATEPPRPIAGKLTLLFFRVKPAEGLQPYLGVWGHLLAASADLVDLLHEHPVVADGGPQVQFNVIFPRESLYRVWVQFQRQGKVNTAAFTIPVSSLK
jgi:hypothetical protein